MTRAPFAPAPMDLGNGLLALGLDARGQCCEGRNELGRPCHGAARYRGNQLSDAVVTDARAFWDKLDRSIPPSA
jgi:hypothetical protein